MTIKSFIVYLVISLVSYASFAQPDKFSGSWQMSYLPYAHSAPINISLKISSPEKGQLYPAQLLLEYENFKGTYNLLLVKKNNNQLGIGRNKIPVDETPFNIGAWTVFLNGTLDFKKDKKGNASLHVSRIPAKRYGMAMPALTNFDEAQRTTALRIRECLQETPIYLNKLNDIEWQSEAINEILNPYSSPSYYGIMDTITVNTNQGKLSFADNNKIDNDTVLVLLNGKLVIDKTDLSRNNPTEGITLDTGMNILVFFADNYGNIPPNTGKLNIAFGKEKFAINFANKADISATFIVMKIYYYPDKPLLPPFELMRNTKIIESLHTKSGEITLAIWDDAVEDGDSISLNINGQWIAQGLAVKKKPKFIKVTLQPGVNNIIFVADNLGSIPPNTSILEIIDNKKRRSFMINTDLKKNNLVKITYDYQSLEE